MGDFLVKIIYNNSEYILVYIIKIGKPSVPELRIPSSTIHIDKLLQWFKTAFTFSMLIFVIVIYIAYQRRNDN